MIKQQGCGCTCMIISIWMRVMLLKLSFDSHFRVFLEPASSRPLGWNWRCFRTLLNTLKELMSIHSTGSEECRLVQKKSPQKIGRWMLGPQHQPLHWLCTVLGNVTATFSTLPGLLICLQSFCVLECRFLFFAVSLCNCSHVEIS